MMPVTGIPFGRWSVAAKTLTENGQSIFFAEPAEQGGYEVVKELNGRRIRRIIRWAIRSIWMIRLFD